MKSPEQTSFRATRPAEFSPYGNAVNAPIGIPLNTLLDRLIIGLIVAIVLTLASPLGFLMLQQR